MSSVEVAQRFFEEFSAYSEYNDSGIDWLGEIPKHWEAKKIKMLCQVKRGASPRPIDSPIYFDDDGEYAWVRISDVTASDRYLLKTEQRLSKLGQSKSVALEPDELFLSIAGSVGKPIITKIKCCIHDGFVYFENLKENRDYLFYLFLGGELYKGLGKLGTQLNLNSDTVGSIVIPVPSLTDQEQIAIFLDRATTEIDQIIEQQKQLITLLEEERTTVISHAVTKGLDSSVPRKDSGIEWLSEIPKHWKLKRLGWITKEINDINHEMPVAVEKGIPFLSAKDLVDNGQLNFTDDVKMISEQDFERLSKKVFPIKEDIIYSRIGARLGKARLVKTDIKFQVSYSCCVIRVKHEVALPEYICFILDSEIVLTEAKLKTVGIGVPDLGLDTIGRFLIPLPTLEEQQGILDYLYQETARIDEAIENVRSQIEKLEEYRTVLISDAVTGKIDVRRFVED